MASPNERNFQYSIRDAIVITDPETLEAIEVNFQYSIRDAGVPASYRTPQRRHVTFNILLEMPPLLPWGQDFLAQPPFNTLLEMPPRRRGLP